MVAVVISQRMTFQKPIVGPQSYAAVGASGWPELFPRKESDQKLCSFLGEQLTVPELIENFAEHVELKNEGRCSWSDVNKYLSRITKVAVDDIPYDVAISFWGHMVLRDKAKIEAKKGKKKHDCER